MDVENVENSDGNFNINDPRFQRLKEALDALKSIDARDNERAPVDQELLRGFFADSLDQSQSDHVRDQIAEHASWKRAVATLLDNGEISGSDVCKKIRRKSNE